MTDGVTKTQKTRLFFAPSETEIHKVTCPTTINIPSPSATQIPKTCLDSDAQENEAGLPERPTGTVEINMIFGSASHQALIAALQSGIVMPWLIVYRGQDDDPSGLDSEGYLVSPGPTTRGFKAYVASMTDPVAVNELVRATLTLQPSGLDFWDLPPISQE